MCLKRLTWIIFFGDKGMFYTNKVLYQYNESAIDMEKYGRNSCTVNWRHIYIRYLFVKDRVDKEEFSIEYCNTLAILIDCFTKPLQGSLFWRLREVIIGRAHVSIMQYHDPPTEKERIENHFFGEKPEIEKKVTYAQIITGGRIGSADGSWWSKLSSKGAGWF